MEYAHDTASLFAFLLLFAILRVQNKGKKYTITNTSTPALQYTYICTLLPESCKSLRVSVEDKKKLRQFRFI